MRPTTPTRAVFHNTRPQMALQRTPQLYGDKAHYMAAYLRVHDHATAQVSKPGTMDPRDKFWWRRLIMVLYGKNRVLYKDNTFAEEQAVVFKDPVPGGHGDRFTHSWVRWPGPNYEAKYAMQNWETRNLTPEQLAMKYGVYVPRPRPEDLATMSFLMTLFWVFLLYHSYWDDDLAFLTHPILDDYLEEMGGVRPITEQDAYLEQWTHPHIYNNHQRKYDPHWSFKPMVLKNCKVERT